jgi:hypothetical protein
MTPNWTALAAASLGQQCKIVWRQYREDTIGSSAFELPRRRAIGHKGVTPVTHKRSLGSLAERPLDAPPVFPVPFIGCANCPLLGLRLELLYECSEMARDWNRNGIVLVPQSFPDCCKRSPHIAGRIDFALRGTGDDVPTYPVVDPVSCGEYVGHGRSPVSPPPIPRQLTNFQSACWVPYIKSRP